MHPKKFIVPVRCLAALRATYTGVTIPVDGGLLVNDGLLPPVGTKNKGRPNVKRIPSCVETQQKRKVTCKRCGETGHNSRGCRLPFD